MNTLIVLLAGLLPTYLIRFPLFGIPTNFFEVAVVTVFLVTMCVPKTRKQLISSMRAIPMSFLVWMCLFLLAAIISTIYSPVLRSSLGVLKGWVVIPMFFGLLVYSVARTVVILHSLTLSGLVVALLGLSQADGFERIKSIYDVPNSLALFLVPVFVIASRLGIQKKDRFYQLSSLIMLIAIIYTQSFGAIIALVGTVVIGHVFVSWFPSPQLGRGILPRRREGEGWLGGMLYGLPSSVIRFAHVTFSPIGEKGNYYLLFFILLIFFTLFFTFSGRIQYLISPFTHPNTTNSATVRLQLWDIGIRLIQKHPILGIGLGQFEPAYQAELHRRFAEKENGLIPEFVFRDPHNWILSFWLNMGLLGSISFVGLNYLAIKGFTLSERSESKGGGRDREHVYNQSITLALISILIFGLFDTIYWKNDLSALWWMLLFLLR